MFYLPLPNKINFKFTLYFIAIIVWAVSCFTYAESQNPGITWEKIHQGAIVIDVRTPNEFSQGHLPNAINIPHQQILDGIKKHNLNPKTSIVLYCKSGNRSGIAQDVLKQYGYSNTYNGGSYTTLIQMVN